MPQIFLSFIHRSDENALIFPVEPDEEYLSTAEFSRDISLWLFFVLFRRQSLHCLVGLRGLKTLSDVATLRLFVLTHSIYIHVVGVWEQHVCGALFLFFL